MTATQPAADPEQRLLALGLELPPAPAPLAAYVPARRAGDLVFVSGQIPMKDGSLIAQGVVPTDVDPETAVRCAVQCTLNGLAALKAEIGTLSRLRRVIRLGCFVASAAGYHEQPKIANGASELLMEVFGEAGRHARAAVGSVDLPLGAPVEIEFVFEVK